MSIVELYNQNALRLGGGGFTSSKYQKQKHVYTKVKIIIQLLMISDKYACSLVMLSFMCLIPIENKHSLFIEKSLYANSLILVAPF